MHRARIRFKLRTVIVAFTMLSVWLGLGLTVHRAREHARRLAVLRGHGSEFKSAYEPDNHLGSKWLRKILGDDYFKTPVSIIVPEPIGDEELGCLSNWTEVRELLVDGPSPFTDDGLTALRQLTEMKSISLTRTRISGKGLRHLTGMSNLRELFLGESEVGDDGMVHLGPLPNLDLKQAMAGRVLSGDLAGAAARGLTSTRA